MQHLKTKYTELARKYNLPPVPDATYSEEQGSYSDVLVCLFLSYFLNPSPVEISFLSEKGLADEACHFSDLALIS